MPYALQPPPKNHYELYDVRGIEQGTRLCYRNLHLFQLVKVYPTSHSVSMRCMSRRFLMAYLCYVFQTPDPEVVAQYR